MSYNFNYLPKNAQVKGNNVFLNDKYIGYVDKIQNWGTDYLARFEKDNTKNKFFNTKKEAVLYLIQLSQKG